MKSWPKAQHPENEDHGIWSHHFKTNRWETVETVSVFIFLDFKITADGDCSHEIKRCFLPGRKSNQSIQKTISPGFSLEGMMLKLKLQYFGHLTRRVDSLEDSDAERDWRQEEKRTTENEMAGGHH